MRRFPFCSAFGSCPTMRHRLGARQLYMDGRQDRGADVASDDGEGRRLPWLDFLGAFHQERQRRSLKRKRPIDGTRPGGRGRRSGRFRVGDSRRQCRYRGRHDIFVDRRSEFTLRILLRNLRWRGRCLGISDDRSLDRKNPGGSPRGCHRDGRVLAENRPGQGGDGPAEQEDDSPQVPLATSAPSPAAGRPERDTQRGTIRYKPERKRRSGCACQDFPRSRFGLLASGILARGEDTSVVV